jgi:site-specific DNA-methyltransferase (adenine-specific)
VSVAILIGDCRERLKELPDNSVDSVVCDPPYHLTSIVKRFGSKSAAPAKVGKTGAYARASRGFMGQQWDGGDVAFDSATWETVLRVLKPGGHLIAFSGTRTYHRMTCAIEDAGFEIRDQLAWVYGSGFPKSHNQPGGWGTALKPSWEPICLGRKPLDGSVAANMAKWGTGALNVDGCRIDFASEDDRWKPEHHRQSSKPQPMDWGVDGERFQSSPPTGRWPANLCHDGSDEVVAGFPSVTTGDRKPTHNGGRADNTAFPSQLSDRAFVGDTGSAARFFYCAKATTDERGEGNNHPTVKPVSLMCWLVRLVTPKGGTVLDPFMGSGSTGLACQAEQFDFIGCELSPEYAGIAEQRMRDAAGLFADVKVAA